MSGPGKQYDGYRCDTCRRRKNRCDDCRAARAAAKRELQARKRASGICVECTLPAKVGVRCAEHQERNRIDSRASHAQARADGRE